MVDVCVMPIEHSITLAGQDAKTFEQDRVRYVYYQRIILGEVFSTIRCVLSARKLDLGQF